MTGWFAGEHEGQRKTQALEFEDYRGYVPGDDFRLIDWNAYGRLGELFAKTSRAEETLPVSLLVYCSRSMDWGTPTKLRYSRQVAAALGALALLHGDPVRVYALGDGMAVPGPALYGPTDLPALTASLPGPAGVHGDGFARCASDFQQTAPPGGVVFVLSDLLAPMADVEMLGFLALPSTAVIVVHVYDLSEALPDLLQGDGRAARPRVWRHGVTLDYPGVRQTYARRFQARAADAPGTVGGAEHPLCCRAHLHACHRPGPPVACVPKACSRRAECPGDAAQHLRARSVLAGAGTSNH